MAKRLVLVAAAVALAVSCGTSRTTVEHRREIKLRPGTVLVVPLRDKENYYYDSLDGGGAADGAILTLAANCPQLAPADYSKVRGLIRSDIMNDGANLDWTAIGRAAEADYVVYGSVDDIRWGDKWDPSMPRCYFTLTYFVHDVKAGTRIYGVTKAGQYPVTLVGDWDIAQQPPTKQNIEQRARAFMGSLIAKSFYSCTISRLEHETVTSAALK